MSALEPLKLRAKNYPFALITLIVFVIVGAYAPAPRELLEEMYKQYTELVKSLYQSQAPSDETVYRIFYYNVGSLIVFSIPLIGPLFAVYTSLSVGLTLKAISVAESVNLARVLTSFFLTPSNWVTLLALSIALTESWWISLVLLRRRGVDLELILAILALAAALLLLSATLEVAL
ncbi:MAG: hypothetical protein NZ954_03820 [Thermofilaceae archaeon]|nr:hypothetical protein [Thermofilaceae archaeon]MCX8181300.1 hypothetical protein [Thermofilaceae archaeon]MDW8004643.1 hypothetical protein [Thermofilaceae archaeon]